MEAFLDVPSVTSPLPPLLLRAPLQVDRRAVTCYNQLTVWTTWSRDLRAPVGSPPWAPLGPKRTHGKMDLSPGKPQTPLVGSFEYGRYLSEARAPDAPSQLSDHKVSAAGLMGK